MPQSVIVSVPVPLAAAEAAAWLAAWAGHALARLDAVGYQAASPRSLVALVEDAAHGSKVTLVLAGRKAKPKDGSLAFLLVTGEREALRALSALLHDLHTLWGELDALPLPLAPDDAPAPDPPLRDGADPARASEQKRLWLPRIRPWVLENRSAEEVLRAIARNHPDDVAPPKRTLQLWMRELRSQHERGTRT